MGKVKAPELISSPSTCTYQVFLSFRGEQTRKAFACHLYTALRHAGFRTLLSDDRETERGEYVKSDLQRTICQQSKVSVVVLSKDYVASGCCLDELVMILGHKKSTPTNVILPVFYLVDPSHIRKQIGSVGEAFAGYEERLKVETDERKKEWMDKVNRWREALREVADLAGFVLQNQPHEAKSKIIQKIVKVSRDKLYRAVSNICFHQVGIDSRVKNINLWLQDGSTDVGVLVITGMGGIGKTTIAKFAYNLNFERFAGSSFLADIREASQQPNGLVRLQRQLLSDILRKEQKISCVDEGIIKIKIAICCKRVFLVLDDVDQVDQLNAILGMRDWLYPGSKIIITTRNEWLLKPYEVYKVYKVENLDLIESLKLLSWHAFGEDHPPDDYMEHCSKRVVKHCQGLPLALKVLGSSLCGKSVDAWKSSLEKLEVIPDGQILKTLEISYESLQDDHDKDLFLHIVCFFIGKGKDYTVEVLDQCDFFTTVGIQNLIDRYILDIDEYNKLRMHQLLRDMGHEIIRQESPLEPGKRSRLWHHKDSFTVLREKTGTETIEGLILDMLILKEDKSTMTISSFNNAKEHRDKELADNSPSNQASSLKRPRSAFFFSQKASNAFRYLGNPDFLQTDAFARMCRLKVLHLNYVQLAGCYEEFPKGLRWLSWRGLSLKFIPSDFPLKNIVVLDMRNSSLEQLWKGNMFLGLLKILNLSHSHGLTRTPNFSGLPNLERLILKDCVSLVEVHESIQHVEGLIYLNLKDCKQLRELPRNIGLLKFLEVLVISGCSNLNVLPTDLRNIESLKVLHADGIPMNRVLCTSKEVQPWHASIWSWASKPKKSLEISWASLPHTLVNLSLADCNLSDEAFSMDFSKFASLQNLNLSRNPICSLPESIKGLTWLQTLDVESCTTLKSLIGVPSSRELIINHCTSLEKISYRSNSSKQHPWLNYSHDCSNLVGVQGRFRLEPIINVDAKILDILGLNLESMKNVEVKLDHFASEKRKKLPVQGLYECGVFSIFLPGNRVPSWFSYKSTSSPIVFAAPSLVNLRIQGLNLCSVYGHHKLPKLEADYFRARCIKIKNRTKHMKWIHTPSVFGIPDANEDMMWLSHWNFGNDLFEAGDEVKVSVHTRHGFGLKEVGIHLVYHIEEENGTNAESCSEVTFQQPTPFLDVVPRYVSRHPSVKRIY